MKICAGQPLFICPIKELYGCHYMIPCYYKRVAPAWENHVTINCTGANTFQLAQCDTTSPCNSQQGGTVYLYTASTGNNS